MTGCENVIENLVDYLEGSLDDSQRQEIETHLMECADCREECAFLRVLFEDAPLAAMSAPASIRLGVMEKIRTQAQSHTEDIAVPKVSIETTEAVAVSSPIEAAEMIAVSSPIEMTDAIIVSDPIETTEVLESDNTRAKSGKIIDLAKLFANKRFTAGLAAACLLVVAIPIYSAINQKDESLLQGDGRSASGANNALSVAPALEESENAPVAPSVSSFDMRGAVLDTEAKKEDNAIPDAAPPIGASAAAERTPREIVADFSETSVRYFNELTPAEDFDLYSFIITIGKENVIETNLKYYFCLNDELYNMLLNQMSNKSQITSFDTDTLKLDPLAKKGIVVVKK